MPHGRVRLLGTRPPAFPTGGIQDASDMNMLPQTLGLFKAFAVLCSTPPALPPGGLQGSEEVDRAVQLCFTQQQRANQD